MLEYLCHQKHNRVLALTYSWETFVSGTQSNLIQRQSQIWILTSRVNKMQHVSDVNKQVQPWKDAAPEFGHLKVSCFVFVVKHCHLQVRL